MLITSPLPERLSEANLQSHTLGKCSCGRILQAFQAKYPVVICPQPRVLPWVGFRLPFRQCLRVPESAELTFGPRASRLKLALESGKVTAKMAPNLNPSPIVIIAAQGVRTVKVTVTVEEG
jgi:hypothetical protein